LKIVDELKDLLEQNSYVHAMWVAGPVAEGQNDHLSDVDLWCDVDDGQDEEILARIEEFLASKDTIDVNFGEGVTPPFTHKVYHLAQMNPLHFIEINLHSHSHKFGLFDRLRTIKVLFDKDDTTKFEPVDEVSYDKMLSERKHFLLEKIQLGELSVRKEITRGSFMDAMHNYQFWLLEPIIEIMRIKYAPRKINYGLKHGSRDLPKDIVSKIESLYFLNSLEDLGDKIEEVKALAKQY
jgi:predicted nucleotidyltransferase